VSREHCHKPTSVVVSSVRAPQRLLAIIAVRVQPQACMTRHDAQVEWHTHNSTRRLQDYPPCSERCSCCCACTHMQTSIRHPGSKSMSKCLALRQPLGVDEIASGQLTKLSYAHKKLLPARNPRALLQQNSTHLPQHAQPARVQHLSLLFCSKIEQLRL